MKRQIFQLIAALSAAVVSGGCFFPRGAQLTVVEYAPELRPVSRVLSTAQVGSVVNLSGSGREFVIRKKNGRVVCDESRRWLISPERMLKNSMLLYCSGTGNSRISAEVLKFEFSGNLSALSGMVRFRSRTGSGGEASRVVAAEVKIADRDYGSCAAELWEKLLNEFFKDSRVLK
ncbi:MAG: hypothetical protein IKC89_04230 [Lentisphaeria bacterium]|nr:hypothetical protein [Lentisphaeria bacterium]